MASPGTTPVADRGAFDPVSVEVEQVAREVGVDPARGLSVDEARSRLESHGPNRLAGGKKEPGWRAFLR
jgi:Ca2+-transporting ATPase